MADPGGREPGDHPIVIAGAGIGGLTAALTLARAGFPVLVLERAARLEEIGAGIQLSPNAARVLLGLGLGPRLQAAVRPEAIVIRRADGARLARIPLGDAAEARYGAPYLLIHRGELQAALVAAVEGAADVTLRLGATVEGFVECDTGLAVLVQGAEIAARALVGADGVWSGVRGRLAGAPPRFTGQIAWRAAISGEARPGHPAETGLWLGAEAHLVHYPVSGGRRTNIVAVVEGDDPGPTWSAPGDAREIRRRFAGWALEAQALVAAASDWRIWPLYDRGPDTGGSRLCGRVALLGDAAHPMLPFLAQGGAMAIEDAATLAAMLARTPDDLEGALRRYEALRTPRIARVVRAARRNAWAFHLAGPMAFIRDMALRLAGGRRLLAGYDWLYGWRPPG